MNSRSAIASFHDDTIADEDGLASAQLQQKEYDDIDAINAIFEADADGRSAAAPRASEAKSPGSASNAAANLADVASGR